jgi:hypothetical protein
MRRAIAVLLASIVVTGAAASVAPRVTIVSGRWFFDPGIGAGKVALSGSISGGAGEPIVVLSKLCGTRDAFRSTGATRTNAGGSWQLVAEFVAAGTTFRARWKRSSSTPYLVRTRLAPRLTAGGGRVRLLVASVADLSGRRVELQRLVLGAWQRVASAPLRRAEGGFQARFPFGVRGATVRGVVPARTAAPCSLSDTTDSLVIGRRQVTIRVRFGGPNGPRQPVLGGTVRSGAAGEPVGIELKGCGPANRSWRGIGSTQTHAGGAWEWTYPDPRVDEPVRLRATWNLSFSSGVLVRTALHARTRLLGRTLRIMIDTEFSGQRMTGRPVELQRKAGGRWATVATASLRRVGAGRYATEFRLSPRGQALRVFVPAKTASPCYLATATRSRTVG